MSIAWHEAFVPGDRSPFAKKPAQRHNAPTGERAEGRLPSISDRADERVHERRHLPKTTGPLGDTERSWRRSRRWPAAFRQERRHDLKLPHAAARTALLLEARHPVQEVGDRLDHRRFGRARNFGFLHPNCKRLIALLHVLLKFAPGRSLTWVKERAPILRACCGAAMVIVRTRTRSAIEGGMSVPIAVSEAR